MRVGVVGSGISGLCLSYLVSSCDANEVTIFEKASALGLDSHSIDVEVEKYEQMVRSKPSANGNDKQSSATLLSASSPRTQERELTDSGDDIRCVINAEGRRVVRVDMPLRVFTESYYPNLTALYDDVGVEYEPEDYSGSFSSLSGQNFFGYRNFLLGKFSFPYFPASIHLLFTRVFWKILIDLLYFLLTAPRHLKSGALGSMEQLKKYVHGEDFKAHTNGHSSNGHSNGQSNGESLSSSTSSSVESPAVHGVGVTLRDYLRQHRYSSEFISMMLVPTLSGICTCTNEAVLNYPAILILHYLATRSMRGVRRVRGGTKHVVDVLSKKCKVNVGNSIQSIRCRPGKNVVHVVDESGKEYEFDHVVLATQANHALNLLQKDPNVAPGLKEALRGIKYEKSQLVLHTDEQLMPKDKRLWKPVNFILPDSLPSWNGPSASSGIISAQGMATIWMNSVQHNIGRRPNVFQTWNPLRYPVASSVLGHGDFERPIVSSSSLQSIRNLWSFQGENRLWFCGSYAHCGVPLLETAVSSAVEVAEKLGVKSPWKKDTQKMEDKTMNANKEGMIRELLKIVMAWTATVMIVVLGYLRE